MTPATVAALQAELLNAARDYAEAREHRGDGVLVAQGMLKKRAREWADAEHQLEVETAAKAKHAPGTEDGRE